MFWQDDNMIANQQMEAKVEADGIDAAFIEACGNILDESRAMGEENPPLVLNENSPHEVDGRLSEFVTTTQTVENEIEVKDFKIMELTEKISRLEWADQMLREEVFNQRDEIRRLRESLFKKEEEIKLLKIIAGRGENKDHVDPESVEDTRIREPTSPSNDIEPPIEQRESVIMTARCLKKRISELLLKQDPNEV